MRPLISSTTKTNFIWWVNNCVNWYLRILEHYHLVREDIIYKMKNGVNLKLRPYTNDADVLKEIYSIRPYTRRIPLPEKPIIIDIGAHIGLFAILVAKDYPGARIFCFEPATDSFSYLEENCAKNKGNFILQRAAVCAYPGSRVIYLDPKNPGNSTFFPTNKTFLSQTVTCTTLEKEIKKNNLAKVDLLKLDCEGSEYEILLKLSPKLLKIISNISAEVHSFDSHHPKQIKDFLKKHSFKVSTFKSGLPGIYYLEAIK